MSPRAFGRPEAERASLTLARSTRLVEAVFAKLRFTVWQSPKALGSFDLGESARSVRSALVLLAEFGLAEPDELPLTSLTKWKKVQP